MQASLLRDFISPDTLSGYQQVAKDVQWKQELIKPSPPCRKMRFFIFINSSVAAPF
jgi:hypothetical protein